MQAIVEAGDHIRTTREEDRGFEAVVLRQVLCLHPGPITLDELVREITGGSAGFGQRDAVERAARDLAGCGLLHLNDALVLPSRAALRFDELLGE